MTTGALSAIGLAGCLGADDGDDSEFPSEDLTFIVHRGPGGGYDEYTRIVAPHTVDQLDSDIDYTVQNVEGAGGIVGMNQLYNSDPDGHSLGLVNLQSDTLNQLHEDTDYDLLEMTHYAQMAEDIRAIGIRPDHDIDTWDEFVTGVQNEELSFASTGLMSSTSLVSFMTGAISGEYDPINVVDNVIPFEGRGEQITALLGGDADVVAGTYWSLLPYVGSDDLDLITVLIDEESAPDETPDVPTGAELGIPNITDIDLTLTGRRIFAGPPEIEDERADVIGDALSDAIQSEEFTEEAEENDRPVAYQDREATEEIFNTSFENWREHGDLISELLDE